MCHEEQLTKIVARWMGAFNLAQFSKAQSSAAQTNVDDLLRNAPLFIHTIQPREKTQNQINSKICMYVSALVYHKYQVVTYSVGLFYLERFPYQRHDNCL